MLHFMMTVDRPAQSREKGFTALARLLPRPQEPLAHRHTHWPRLLKSPGKAGSSNASSFWAWLRLCLLHWGLHPSCLFLLLLPSVQALSYDKFLYTKHSMGPHLGLSHVGSFFSDRSFFHPASEYCEILRLHRKSADKKAINFCESEEQVR